MGDRRAEQGHDGIADMLVDAAAIAGCDCICPGVEGLHHAAQILGIEPGGERREAREIGEEDRDLAPLARRLSGVGRSLRRLRYRLGLGARFAAAAAEALPGLIGEAAERTAPAQLGAAAGTELAAFAILLSAAPAAHEIRSRSGTGRPGGAIMPQPRGLPTGATAACLNSSAGRPS